MSLVERDTYKSFKLRLENQGKKIVKKELQEFVSWVLNNAKGITESKLNSTLFQDSAGKGINSSAENWNYSAGKLFPIFQKCMM